MRSEALIVEVPFQKRGARGLGIEISKSPGSWAWGKLERDYFPHIDRAIISIIFENEFNFLSIIS